MGIMVSKEDENTKLTERVNSDLRARAAENSSDEADKDFAENSEYIEHYEKTGRFSWIWIVLIILAVISLIFIALL